MTKLKIAILEDEPEILKDLKRNLQETGLVEIIAWATSSTELYQKLEGAKPEALILDIDLRGEKTTGLDVALKFKLPVLFVSGKTTLFNNELEDIESICDFVAIRLRKPYTNDILKKKIIKLIDSISARNDEHFVWLDFLLHGRQRIDLNSIAFLSSKGSDSGNKEIYFINREPEVLIDFSFSRMHEKKFDKESFLTIHKQYRVNQKNIMAYLPSNEVTVEYMNAKGEKSLKNLPVSEDYRPAIRKKIR